MRDQASELRKLVLQSMRESATRISPAPKLIVVAGAQEGVGVTTLSINLAAAFGIQGLRVVLVDASRDQLDIAARLGLEITDSPDVFSSRVNIHELLLRGPAGVLVVPGLWSTVGVENVTDTSQFRLIHQLQSLGRHADVVLLDVGCNPAPIVNRFWDAADSIILVATSDAVAVMNAYSEIKRHQAAAQLSGVHLVLNHTDSLSTVEEVGARFDQSCQKFLEVRLASRTGIPTEGRLQFEDEIPIPALMRWPQSEMAKAIERLAASYVSWDRQNMTRRNVA